MTTLGPSAEPSAETSIRPSQIHLLGRYIRVQQLVNIASKILKNYHSQHSIRPSERCDQHSVHQATASISSTAAPAASAFDPSAFSPSASAFGPSPPTFGAQSVPPAAAEDAEMGDPPTLAAPETPRRAPKRKNREPEDNKENLQTMPLKTKMIDPPIKSYGVRRRVGDVQRNLFGVQTNPPQRMAVRGGRKKTRKHKRKKNKTRRKKKKINKKKQTKSNKNKKRHNKTKHNKKRKSKK